MLINKNLERFLLTRDTTLTQNDVSTILKRTQIIVKQDSVGGHKVILGAGLVGDVPINMQPDSITLLVTLVADDVVYCYSELSPTYSTIGTGTTNAYTKVEADNRFYPLTLNPAVYATESWVNSKGYLTSASFSNYWTKAQSDARYLNQSGGTGGGFSGSYLDLTNKPFIPSKTSDITNDSGYITGYSEVDTLNSVLARGNTSAFNMNISGAVNLSGSLQIPSTPSNLPNSIWLSTANSTGHTGSSGGASALSELLDVQLTSPLNGQALLFNGTKWVNSTIITDLSNYYTKGQTDNLFQLKGNYLTSVDYSIITNKPTIPTNTNQLTNGAGYITGYSEVDTLNSVLSRGNSSAIDMNLSGKLSVTGELVIPSTPSNSINAIWIGTASSTGNTGGGSGVSYLSALLDTQISSPLNGQSLVFNGSKWVNTTAFAGDYNALQNKPNLGSFAYRNSIVGNEVQTDISNAGWDNGISQLLRWKNYGNGHVIFDASNGTSPHNSSISSTNSQVPWQASFPTLMGWNGQSTYGVRVDSARTADSWGGRGADLTNYQGVTGNALLSLGGDGAVRLSDLFQVRNWLGLGSAAYANESDFTLQYVTNRGNTTNRDIGIGADGTGSDPYGVMSVTRNTTFNYSYYGMTRSGQIGWGIGIDTSNRIAFGTGANGSSGYVMSSIPHTFDAGGNTVHSGNVNAGGNIGAAGSLSINGSSSLAGNTTIHNGSTLQLGNDGNTGYYFSTINQRGDTLHKYLYRNSDAAALPWKEAWYNGSTYYGWSMDSKGFVANGKITTVSSEDGSVTYQGALEVRGVNAGITFHYPGSWASPLWVNSAGTLHWGAALNIGANINAPGYIYTPSTIDAGDFVRGQRIIAGYDSGVAGSVNANGWFRSLDATGWFNASYGGGIWMTDTTWVRTYGGKGFLVDSQIRGNYITSYDGYKSLGYRGLIGDYDQTGTSEKIIWTIGDNWNTIGTMYGIGYQYATKYGNAHSIVFRTAGNVTSAINLENGNANFDGSVTATRIKATSTLVIPTTPSNEVGAIWIA